MKTILLNSYLLYRFGGCLCGSLILTHEQYSSETRTYAAGERVSTVPSWILSGAIPHIFFSLESCCCKGTCFIEECRRVHAYENQLSGSSQHLEIQVLGCRTLLWDLWISFSLPACRWAVNERFETWRWVWGDRGEKPAGLVVEALHEGRVLILLLLNILES